MRLKFFATYRDITRCNETDIPAPSDVWGLLSLLGERYGAPMREKLYTPDGSGIGQDAIILVNGQNVAHLGGKETPLAETDVVCIFPMVAGG
jgi:molybdopterin synthase sulfur carrier subunit